MKKKLDTRPKAPFWYDYPEDENNKSKLAMFLRARDREIEAQHQFNVRNVCPHCHLVLSTTGVCSECGFVKAKVDFKKTASRKHKETRKVSDEMAQQVVKMMAMGFSMEEAIKLVLEGEKV
jgi:uncharacterized protein (DUF2225 family)